MDPFSLTTAIVTLAKNCIDVIKFVQPKDGKNSNISANDFASLQNNLINISRYTETLIEQIVQKDKEIDRLRQTLEEKKSFLFKKYYYFEVDDNGKVIDGPFCKNVMKPINRKSIYCREVRKEDGGVLHAINRFMMIIIILNLQVRNRGQRSWGLNKKHGTNKTFLLR